MRLTPQGLALFDAVAPVHLRLLSPPGRDDGAQLAGLLRRLLRSCTKPEPSESVPVGCARPRRYEHCVRCLEQSSAALPAPN